MYIGLLKNYSCNFTYKSYILLLNSPHNVRYIKKQQIIKCLLHDLLIYILPDDDPNMHRAKKEFPLF